MKCAFCVKHFCKIAANLANIVSPRGEIKKKNIRFAPG